MKRIMCTVAFLPIILACVLAAPAPPAAARGRCIRIPIVIKRCGKCRRIVSTASCAGQHCPYCRAYWAYETARNMSSSSRTRLPKPPSRTTDRAIPRAHTPQKRCDVSYRQDWMRKRPASPGEITVRLANGSYVTGRLTFEDDTTIRMATETGICMAWQKAQLAEIVRYDQKQP